MSDSTQFQLTIYSCPDEAVQHVIDDILNEYRLKFDYSSAAAPEHFSLILGRQYTDDCFGCGDASNVGSLLGELGCTFECWEDPAYEWLGDYVANVRDVGSFCSECDANGNPMMKDHDLEDLVEQATDLDELKATVRNLTGSQVRRAIRAIAKEWEQKQDVELIPQEDGTVLRKEFVSQ